jgi:hypothetical protein
MLNADGDDVSEAQTLSERAALETRSTCTPHCRAVMIAFVAVHSSSIGRLNWRFGRRRLTRFDDEQRQPQPELQPLRLSPTELWSHRSRAILESGPQAADPAV